MRYLAATLHTIGFRLSERASTTFQDDPQRGSVTIENVLWAVAFIASEKYGATTKMTT